MQHRLEQVHVDHLAHPAVHGDHRGECGHERGDLVGEGDGWEHRAAVGFTVHMGEPRHGFGQRGESGSMRIRTRLPEAADSGDHQLRVRGDEFVGQQTEGLELARPEVLDHHVGGGDEATQHLEFLGLLQVEHDAALAPTGQLPEQRDVVGRIAPPHGPHGVARSRTLDLDDIGTEVGEMTGAAGAGEHGGHVDDPQIGEGRGQLGHGRQL